MNCKICENGIESYPSTEGKKRYCSVECREKAQFVLVKCRICEAEYKVAKSRYNLGIKFKFCSEECLRIYRKKRSDERRNKNTYVCKNCGEKFLGYRSGNKSNVFCSQNCSKEYMRGENAYPYVNGTTINKQGYRLLRIGDKYLYEHRLVMEEHIGRKFKKDEIVHHKDGDKLNNKIKNLELMDKKEHDKLHTIRRHENEKRFGGGRKSSCTV